MTHTPEYRIWNSMVQRCTNPKVQSWPYYGARGIKVCERWLKFENFIADTGPRTSPQHSIDRYPNNNGNYEPTNCRWATRQQQDSNKQNSRFLSAFGMTDTVTNLARRHHVSSPLVRARLKKGWPPEQALAPPRKYSHKNFYSYIHKFMRVFLQKVFV
jgi:hypothetical protein